MERRGDPRHQPTAAAYGQTDHLSREYVPRGLHQEEEQVAQKARRLLQRYDHLNLFVRATASFLYCLFVATRETVARFVCETTPMAAKRVIW